jgi:uncharacterized protein YjfI (DUF2170 family)
MTTPWTTESLYRALSASQLSDTGITLELSGGDAPSIAATMPDHGDLVIQIAASGDQVFVSAPLCNASQVKDRNRFNEACLRLNPVNPLSNVGLLTLDGDDLYIVFGELSATAPLSNVVEEILVLADNTLEAAEAFSGEMVTA